MNFYLIHRIFPIALLLVTVILIGSVVWLPQIFLFIEGELKSSNRRCQSYRYYMFVALALAIISALTGFILFIKN